MADETLTRIREMVEALDLREHPEGGYYRETYRAPSRVPSASLPDGFSGDRDLSTAIYYLLPEGEKSRLHRLKADELWHLYEGGPLSLVMLGGEGRLKVTTLGRDIRAGQRPQTHVPAGTWFGAYPERGSGFALAGCTMAPGFDFADFEMGARDRLTGRYPEARDMIRLLTDL